MSIIQAEIKKIEEYIKLTDRKDISISSIEEQLSLFVNGVKIPELVKPCIIGDGIVNLEKSDYDELIKAHNSASESGRIIKFVPASGVASRMFQKFQSVLNRFPNLSFAELKIKSETDKECNSVYEFLTNISKFAFYDDLKSILNVDEIKIENLINESPAEILKAVLFEDGLNYSSKPKGTIKFHRYENECRTAFEEQIYEALNYITGKGKTVKIHFTISQEHNGLFTEIIEELKSKLSKTELTIDITYSYQKKSTDTIAVDENNNILFDKSGNIIHRPGGHGALLENLNDLNGDIVVIKNIDNLSTENLAAETILFKKLLVGFLVKIQEKVFHFLHVLENENLNKEEMIEILLFSKNHLNITQSEKFDILNIEQKRANLFKQLNRPIRICGMVKNEGEPGGGPFWVKSEDGSLSLQIVEQAQINTNDENQKNIFMHSTHFNPVDLICSVRDYKGDNFNLSNFVDHHSGIISKKSKDGIEIKVLELPGLWNGSMADWITIFVEVPISTFNPVKEINDLLRKTHQN